MTAPLAPSIALTSASMAYAALRVATTSSTLLPSWVRYAPWQQEKHAAIVAYFFLSLSLLFVLSLDKCGVCEGRNDTCEEFTGNVYVSDLLKQKKPASSLYYVTTIPKGV